MAQGTCAKSASIAAEGLVVLNALPELATQHRCAAEGGGLSPRTMRAEYLWYSLISDARKASEVVATVAAEAGEQVGRVGGSHVASLRNKV